MNNIPTTAVKIWDLPTRIFHWTLVLGMGFMWLSAELGGLWMDWHMQVGIFMLALLIFRIIWGLVGSDTDRFALFLKSPKTAIHHLKEMQASGTAYHAGHNPLGAWMVVFLLGGLLFQAITGLFANDDILVEGPLYAFVSEVTAKTLNSLHHLWFNILLLAAVVHILSVGFYKIRKRTNLIKAMISGSADWPVDQQPIPEPLNFKSPWLALSIFIVCYGAVFFGLQVLSQL